jgi:hypothetical protein
MKAQSIPDPVSDTLISGSVSFNGTTPRWVALDEDSADYSIFIDGDVNETLWVTGKATGGFNINSSNSSSTASVMWMLVR